MPQIANIVPGSTVVNWLLYDKVQPVEPIPELSVAGRATTDFIANVTSLTPEEQAAITAEAEADAARFEPPPLPPPNVTVVVGDDWGSVVTTLVSTRSMQLGDLSFDMTTLIDEKALATLDPSVQGACRGGAGTGCITSPHHLPLRAATLQPQILPCFPGP